MRKHDMNNIYRRNIYFSAYLYNLGWQEIRFKKNDLCMNLIGWGIAFLIYLKGKDFLNPLRGWSFKCFVPIQILSSANVLIDRYLQIYRYKNNSF